MVNGNDSPTRPLAYECVKGGDYSDYSGFRIIHGLEGRFAFRAIEHGLKGPSPLGDKVPQVDFSRVGVKIYKGSGLR